MAKSYKPTKGMVAAAKRGLKAREDAGGKGGLDTKQAGKAGIGSGVARARDIAAGKSLSLETVKQMGRWYSRHKKNYTPGDATDKGTISHWLWGFPAALGWVRDILRREGVEYKLVKQLDEMMKPKKGDKFSVENDWTGTATNGPWSADIVKYEESGNTAKVLTTYDDVEYEFPVESITKNETTGVWIADASVINKHVEHQYKISKVDQGLGLVFGWGQVTKERTEKGLEDFYDSDNDCFAEEGLVEAWDGLMSEGRVLKANHCGDQIGDVVFCFPFTEQIAKSLGFDVDTIPRTGTLVGVRPQPDIFAKYESGEWDSFSVGGDIIDMEEPE